MHLNVSVQIYQSKENELGRIDNNGFGKSASTLTDKEKIILVLLAFVG